MEDWQEQKAIPFDTVVRAINSMVYGSTERVMFLMLFLTGMRVSELDNCLKNNLKGDILYWRLGKNQHTGRHEKLPLRYITELLEYRETHRVSDGRLFGIDSHTFRTYFDKFIRRKLPSEWMEQISDPSYNLHRKRYKLQLKGLRKDFQTLEFAKNLKKWKDGYLAMEFTSKRMKHESTKVTAYHYVEEFEHLNVEKYIDMKPGDIINICLEQKRIVEWL